MELPEVTQLMSSLIKKPLDSWPSCSFLPWSFKKNRKGDLRWVFPWDGTVTSRLDCCEGVPSSQQPHKDNIMTVLSPCSRWRKAGLPTMIQPAGAELEFNAGSRFLATPPSCTLRKYSMWPSYLQRYGIQGLSDIFHSTENGTLGSAAVLSIIREEKAQDFESRWV